jgi:hypothetical protein
MTSYLPPVGTCDTAHGRRGLPADYNTGRPHMTLGPGVPDPPPATIDHPHPNSRHRPAESYVVRVNSILGGLHHEYSGAGHCVIEFLRTTPSVHAPLISKRCDQMPDSTISTPGELLQLFHCRGSIAFIDTFSGMKAHKLILVPQIPP